MFLRAILARHRSLSFSRLQPMGPPCARKASLIHLWIHLSDKMTHASGDNLYTQLAAPPFGNYKFLMPDPSAI